MIWYRTLDYLRTRNGQILALTLVLTLSIVAAARWQKSRQAEQAQEKSRLRQLAPDEFWDEGSQESLEDQAQELEISEINSSSRVLRLPPPRQVAPQEQEKPEPVILPEPLVSEFVPRAPLIVFERSSQSTNEQSDSSEDQEETSALPSLEPGRLLYCQTVSPISSGQGNGQVALRLVRPHVEHGEVVLPVGTILSGQLSGADDKRLLFGNTWLAILPSRETINFIGQLQERGFLSKANRYLQTDGSVGLAGVVSNKEKKPSRWNRIGSVMIRAAGRLAQDRVRTEIGDFIPGTARNVVIRGSSEVLGDLLDQEVAPHGVERPTLTVPAGMSCYVLVTGGSGD
ncbi:MAG: hypothetical protein ACON4R_08880 [Akkermansiaceae bacterium]